MYVLFSNIRLGEKKDKLSDFAHGMFAVVRHPKLSISKLLIFRVHAEWYKNKKHENTLFI